MNPRLRRRLRRAAGWGAVLFAVLLVLANRWVINSTDSFLNKDSALLPDNEVGLVLGCSPLVASGKPSPAPSAFASILRRWENAARTMASKRRGSASGTRGSRNTRR